MKQDDAVKKQPKEQQLFSAILPPNQRIIQRYFFYYLNPCLYSKLSVFNNNFHKLGIIFLASVIWTVTEGRRSRGGESLFVGIWNLD